MRRFAFQANEIGLQDCSGGKKAPEQARQRHSTLKWNGWGYKDSKFQINSRGQVEFTGNSGRYKISGQELPYLREWAEKAVGMNISYRTPTQELDEIVVLPPVRNADFLDAVKRSEIEYSDKKEDRLFHSHGHTCHEIFALRHDTIKRVPDLVVWPESHEDVEKLVRAACLSNVCLIPFGGGTSVSGALTCPADEKRMIVSLDMTAMNKILWIDRENLTVRAEAGIIGFELDDQLQKKGFCTGHEPDSREMSSLGGWVATRASGMKKNVYGNIEDLLVHVRMVTPTGVVERSCQVPRISAGPDIHEFIMGSEGILGVITEVTLKIRPLPQVRKFGSLVFPDFETGVNCLREIAKQRCAPASIRLVDNNQFQFGHALKDKPGWLRAFSDGVKRIYVTKFKGFDPQKLCVATILYEGTKENVSMQERLVNAIAKSFGALPAGGENGERGYLLTYVIAYLRDFGLDYSVVAESFETSVPWDRVVDLCRNVKERVRRESEARASLVAPPFVSCRVTQTYDSGACVYFYMVINYRGVDDPVAFYDEIEKAARREILDNGGSISHHHGIGKIRKEWVTETISKVGVDMLRAVKAQTDPHNVFGSGNILSKL
ncbi:alkyldihydroxyacetonephosphate synthase, peroxisomal-like [Oscarella lobularis]|uniref:alkyldihydroxyacetonephosphate synthase, peroxisomal-like n=1 Tax=Oscarella lobularis TaxID=121494 RepID=UPI0033144C63